MIAGSSNKVGYLSRLFLFKNSTSRGTTLEEFQYDVTGWLTLSIRSPDTADFSGGATGTYYATLTSYDLNGNVTKREWGSTGSGARDPSNYTWTRAEELFYEELGRLLRVLPYHP